MRNKAQREQEKKVIDALIKGDNKTVNAALAEIKEINAQDVDGNTFFHFIATRRELNYEAGSKVHGAGKKISGLIKLLVDHNANPNLARNDGKTPLMLAAEKGFGGIVEQLVKVPKIKINEQADGFDQLAFDTDLENAGKKEGAELKGKKAKCYKEGDAEARKWLKEKKYIEPNKGDTALMLAVKNGHDAVARVLIKAGADKEIEDINRNTAKSYAKEGKSLAIKELLGLNNSRGAGSVSAVQAAWKH